MENASKALLIAGGVLIALITIALLVKSFSTISEFQMSQLSEQEQQELIAFNEQYAKYLNQYVYGTEVITVINRALDDTTYPITVKIKFVNIENGYTFKGYKVYEVNGKKMWKKEDILIKKGGTLTITNDPEGYSTVESKIYSLKNDDGSEAADSINTMAFKCTNVGYDDSNGRVNSITFVEKEWGDLY